MSTVVSEAVIAEYGGEYGVVCVRKKGSIYNSRLQASAGTLYNQKFPLFLRSRKLRMHGANEIMKQ